MTTRGVITEQDRAWAAAMLTNMYCERGSWQLVADALAPYRKLSRSAWWQSSRGHKITWAKWAALRAYIGRPVSRPPRPRPERASLNVRRETWDTLNETRKDWGVTWDALLVELFNSAVGEA